MSRNEHGMVTVELAAGLPVLVLLLSFAICTVTAFDERTRLQDAALAAARAYARGDTVNAAALADRLAPGSAVDIATAGDEVTVIASGHVTLLPGLPAVAVTAQAVAALEPGISP